MSPAVATPGAALPLHEPLVEALPGRPTRVAAFGGIYSNHRALEAAITHARERGAEAILCLGDLGAFGPSPDRTIHLLRDAGIPVVRGNYDDSIARGLDDCQCGYTDPRDNHYARISYEYTLANTSPESRRWMAAFPREIRFNLGPLRVLAFHGSPRRMNEFLWETTTPTHFLRGMAETAGVDVLLGTHTGIHWSRDLGGGRWYVNAGALGRPANDGRREVWYAMLSVDSPGPANGANGTGPEVGGRLQVEFMPVLYPVDLLADEMRDEGLPHEFIETIRTGWWTTCLEVLPGKERARGRW
ncbi:MAG: metallophosphoesterase [Gemmatimonadales bacterium]|nr:MAG: metallophosphoesterase [Gemmatimonadales bacterium]